MLELFKGEIPEIESRKNTLKTTQIATNNTAGIKYFHLIASP